MSKPLFIYGAGGFARGILALVEDINRSRLTWTIRGFIDDDQSRIGAELHGLPILGDADYLLAQQDVSVVLGMGSPASKYRVSQRLVGSNLDFPILIHPTAIYPETVHFGRGVTVAAGNILICDITVQEFVSINRACSIGHDSVLGAYSTYAPGCNISGNVEVGEGSDVGTGSSVIQGKKIGEWSIIGAGTVIVKDVPANCTAVGVPAKVIKQRDAGWHMSEGNPPWK